MNDQVRLVIIGTGDAYSILLQRQAWDLGIYHKVLFIPKTPKPQNPKTPKY